MRKLLLSVAVALVLAACGDTADESAATTTTTPDVAVVTDDSATAAAPTTAASAEDETETTAAPADDAVPSFDGPPAPDFELALADGSTFVLSDEQKPVYLVFWAEW